MRKSTHDFTGGVFGVLTTLVTSHRAQRPVGVAELLGAWVGGTLGSRFPDAIEPATSPHHSKGAHSVTVLAAAVAWLAPRVRELEDRCLAYAAQIEGASPLWALAARMVAGLLRGLVSGYGSHLLLDATTPMRIPLLPS
jgi:hypothetical protein